VGNPTRRMVCAHVGGPADAEAERSAWREFAAIVEGVLRLASEQTV
jgi:hypothetical protein